MTTPPPCETDVFENGTTLLVANTWTRADAREDLPAPRATGLEEWVVRIRAASGQRVDWHYAGGRACVLFIGDRDAVLRAVEADPCPAQVLR